MKTEVDTITQVAKHDEHSQTAVPLSERRSIFGPLAVWVGYAFFPSGVMAAIAIGGRFAFKDALLITFLGCIILAFISGLAGVMGQREGLTFGLLSKFTWGTKGYRIAAMAPPLGLIGWGGIHLSVAALFLSTSFGIPYAVACIGSAALFGFVALQGFKYMAYVANAIIPLVLIMLAYGVFRSLEILGGVQGLLAYQPANVGTMSIAAGATSMVGTFACGTGGGSADIQRWCKTQRSAVLVAVLTFGVFYTYLMATGTIIALGANSVDLIEAFTKLDMLMIATFVLVFLTWTTCDTDYYSGSLSIAAVTGIPRKYGVMILPTIACILAIFKFYQYLNMYLLVMVALIVPLVGTMAADYFILNKGKYPDISTTKIKGIVPEFKVASFIGWVSGAAVILITQQIDIGMPPVQGIVAAFILTWISGLLIKQPFDMTKELE